MRTMRTTLRSVHVSLTHEWKYYAPHRLHYWDMHWFFVVVVIVAIAAAAVYYTIFLILFLRLAGTVDNILNSLKSFSSNTNVDFIISIYTYIYTMCVCCFFLFGKDNKMKFFILSLIITLIFFFILCRYLLVSWIVITKFHD